MVYPIAIAQLWTSKVYFFRDFSHKYLQKWGSPVPILRDPYKKGSPIKGMLWVAGGPMCLEVPGISLEIWKETENLANAWCNHPVAHVLPSKLLDKEMNDPMSHPVTASDNERNLKQTSQTHLFIQEKHIPKLFIAGSGDHESRPLILVFSFNGGSWTKGIRQKQWSSHYFIQLFPIISSRTWNLSPHFFPKKNTFQKGHPKNLSISPPRFSRLALQRMQEAERRQLAWQSEESARVFRFFFLLETDGWSIPQKMDGARLGTGGCSGFEHGHLVYLC